MSHQDLLANLYRKGLEQLPDLQTPEQFTALCYEARSIMRQIHKLAEERGLWIDGYYHCHRPADMETGHIQALINDLLKRARTDVANAARVSQNGSLDGPDNDILKLYGRSELDGIVAWIRNEHPIVRILEDELTRREVRYSYTQNSYKITISIKK